MDSATLRALAEKGAKTRLAELHIEMQALLQAFPNLTGLAVKPTPSVKVVKTATTRHRRPLTDDERKAIGERMRKYWAGRRKAKKGAKAA